jgi:SAM-dependent methyltransferase
MPNKSEWHYMKWNTERVNKFWNFATHCQAWEEDYFSKQVGAGLVNFVRFLTPLHGRVLDYGCGPGYLLTYLLNAGVSCEGVDSSLESVERVNAQFGTNPLWRGAKVSTGTTLPYPDGFFDMIFCIETVEHVLPEHLNSVLGELRRVLKPTTGKLLITAPNSEDLTRSYVFCAECNSVSHRYQHVSSFTAETLKNLLSSLGFDTVLCSVTNFGDFQRRWFTNPLNWSPRYLSHLLLNAWVLSLDLIRFPGAPPGGRYFRKLIGRGGHLFWFGTRG